MPVNFLTEDQRSRWGRFNEAPDFTQLGGFFHLEAADRRRAMAANGARNQLGYAIQLGTARFLNCFLPDPEDVPAVVVDYVAEQLGLDSSALKGYGEKEARWDHQKQIREAYGFEVFEEHAFALACWIYRRAWSNNERPIVLLDLVTHRLVEAKILLPGVSTVERMISEIRERVALRQYKILAALPSPGQKSVLEELVTVAEGRRISGLDRLRKSPTDVSGAGVGKALERHVELRGLGAAGWDLSAVPAGKVAALARFAKAARAKAVADLAGDRKLATLVAFAAVMEPVSADEAIEVFDLAMGDLVRTSAFKAGKERLRTLKDLDTAAIVLREVWLAIRDVAADPDGDVRAALDGMDLPAIHAAADTIGELAQEPDEDFQDQLLQRYATIRRFLTKLLKVIDFHAGAAEAERSGAGQGTRRGFELLEAIDFLKSLERRRSPVRPEEVPSAHLTSAWHRRVFPKRGEKAGEVNTLAYTVATVERLRECLRRHEVFVPGLPKWGDPTAGLLAGPAWERARAKVCRDLGLSAEPGADTQRWARTLDFAYKQLAAGLSGEEGVRNEWLRIEKSPEGKDHLVLTGLEALDEPATLTALRADVETRMPIVDLPEVLLEVHSWTGCLDAFTHVSGEVPSRREDMVKSIAAVLVAQAMNVGMRPVASDHEPALALDRLFWAEQNYIRAATLTAANATLVDYHAQQEIVQTWGGGELASADGLRFVVPVKTINAGPNTKYFGKGKGARGVTYYNFTSDQFTGFHGIVIPGTPKDWYYILEGLLEQETSLRPTEVVSDTAGASELAFGIFRLLGWQFSPRLADVGSATLYRADAAAFYGRLNTMIKTRVNIGLVNDHWDDLLRVAGSLHTGAVRPAELFRYLTGGGTPTPIGRALMELGKLDRSVYLASYFNDELLRRRVNTQLNRQEARHTLARRIFHGQKGELRQKYKEGQEDQLGALGLMTNVCILWNTVYTARALEQIRAEGKKIATVDIARLSPLGFEWLNFLGRYNFSLPEAVREGNFRPLRAPGQQ
ncbi:Tn3 family transposase [Nonomuraea sp. NPDC049158]|uniref:Tn3 family transposase n=1 Tax=Nonomuraea sp. NPDC049158 TaxID=3155649 RepID=UPI00340B228F